MDNRLPSSFRWFFKVKLERFFRHSLNDFDDFGSDFLVERRSAFDFLQRFQRERVLLHDFVSVRLEVVRCGCGFFRTGVLRAFVANVVEGIVGSFVDGGSGDYVTAAFSDVELGGGLLFVAGFEVNRVALGRGGGSGKIFGRDRFLPVARFWILFD